MVIRKRIWPWSALQLWQDEPGFCQVISHCHNPGRRYPSRLLRFWQATIDSSYIPYRVLVYRKYCCRYGNHTGIRQSLYNGHRRFVNSARQCFFHCMLHHRHSEDCGAHSRPRRQNCTWSHRYILLEPIICRSDRIIIPRILHRLSVQTFFCDRFFQGHGLYGPGKRRSWSMAGMSSRVKQIEVLQLLC